MEETTVVRSWKTAIAEHNFQGMNDMIFHSISFSMREELSTYLSTRWSQSILRIAFPSKKCRGLEQIARSTCICTYSRGPMFCLVFGILGRSSLIVCSKLSSSPTNGGLFLHFRICEAQCHLLYIATIIGDRMFSTREIDAPSMKPSSTSEGILVL